MFRAAILITLLLVLPAQAWTYFLEKDLGTSGFQRYCLYSNDKTYTVNSYEICPMSVEEGVPDLGGGLGFYEGEYKDGLTKVCVYSVMGEKKAIRQSLISLCPLSHRF